MAVDNIKLTFSNDFEGTMTSPTGTLPIGKSEDSFRPYHLLFGALGSCLYATFIPITYKMRLSFEEANLEISGNKRKEVPSTLDYVQIKFVIKNPSKGSEDQFRKAAELASKYCSIHETISKVAKIEMVVSFEYQ